MKRFITVPRKKLGIYFMHMLTAVINPEMQSFQR